jgi:signal transduction histidine kinase/CheY-like chemotaxis protein
MENPASVYDAATWFGLPSVHQDFFWFAALSVWIVAVLVWRRHPGRTQAWAWVPAIGGATIAVASVQLAMFNPTFDVFQERLVPGSVSNFRPAPVDPHWFTDVLVAAALFGMVAWWAWEAMAAKGHARWRWLVWPVALVLLTIHAASEVEGIFLVAVLPVLAAVVHWRATRGDGFARAGLVGAVVMPTFSSVGPVAWAVGLMQRQGPPTPMGLAMAAGGLLVGGWVLTGLLRGLWQRQHPATVQALRRDLRWAVGLALVWVLLGVAVAVRTGQDNRVEIQQNRLRATAAQANVFDPKLIEPLADPAFRIEMHSQQGEPAAAHAPWLKSESLAWAQRRLAQVVISTPFLEEARIVVLRDGWLVAVLSSERPVRDGYVEVLRAATAEDVRRWEEQEQHVETSMMHEIGYPYFCRAPIVAADGRMLGWLDCVRREYYLSVERRWRSGPLLVTALGIGLIGLLLVQRQAHREGEVARRVADQATTDNEIKSVFLANVSHELRTPLQNILGYGELIDRLPGTAEQRAQLAALRGQAELMLRLVNDLIDLSAVDAGAFKLARGAVELPALVRETAESLRPRAAAKGLELVCAVDGSVPPWVTADGGRLRQVLLNLVSNAVKFTDRGRVTVRASATPRLAGGWQLRLEVADTGPGIPAAQLGQLFRAFSRLEQTADREGTGLGLAISDRLCRAMGGGLRVESEGGKGSRFIAEVVVAPGDAPLAMARAVSPATFSQPAVVVAEDNRLMRDLFIQALSERGAVCRPVADGASLLAELARETPQVVVLDLGLAGEDGLSFVPRIRELAPACRVVVVSAQAAQAERDRVRAAGVDVFLMKPVTLDALWGAVSGHGAPAVQLPDFFAAAPEAGAQVRALFLAELPAWRVAVEDACQRRDFARVRERAHFLRSGAIAARATAVYHACEALERAAATGEVDVVQAAWAKCCVALGEAGNSPGRG